MKKVLILSAAMMITALYVKAQASDPELDYIKKAYSKEKKALVDNYMGLDVQESGKFWPVYSTYEASREKLAHERYNLITHYVHSVGHLTPEGADNMAKGILDNNVRLEQLNRENYNKMKTAIGPIKAAKFLQLEIYLQTSWKAYVQDNIPFIDELDKTKHH
ncbi:MAG TPA: hypothetical protein VNU72_04655 [Puia sp.]|nr:hypothetical protein [Puia sp.]